MKQRETIALCVLTVALIVLLLTFSPQCSRDSSRPGAADTVIDSRIDSLAVQVKAIGRERDGKTKTGKSRKADTTKGGKNRPAKSSPVPTARHHLDEPLN